MSGVYTLMQWNKSKAMKGAHIICGIIPDMLANTFDVPKDEVESWTPYAGGAPCNVSTALAKLGVKSSFASAVGKDDMGNTLMDILKGKQFFSALHFSTPVY